MDAGFMNVVEIGQYFMTSALQNSRNFWNQWRVVSTLCQEKKKHHNQKDGSKGTQILAPYWKLQPVACKVDMEWKIKLCL